VVVAEAVALAVEIEVGLATELAQVAQDQSMVYSYQEDVVVTADVDEKMMI
jgi:hypothetical protein